MEERVRYANFYRLTSTFAPPSFEVGSMTPCLAIYMMFAKWIITYLSARQDSNISRICIGMKEYGYCCDQLLKILLHSS